MWGLTLEEASEPTPIWPDNLVAYNAFVALLSQWRVGAAGATGLDYTAIPVVLDMLGTPKVDWPNVFADIRVMEDAALEQMSANQKAKK